MSSDKPADSSVPVVLASTPPQHRIALCIGNAAYPQARLANTVNDATDFAKYLRERLGFTVVVVCDGSKHAMEVAFERLLAAIQPGTVVVLFFAGHACEVDGVNYLLPIMDSLALSDADLRNQGVRAQWMQEKVWERKPAVVLFILDACRNNPFKGTRSLGGALASMEPLGSLLLFACAPGQLAQDGIGSRNSPLTTHLMQHLHVGEVHAALRKVISAVYTSTNKQQKPWTHSDMMDEFYWHEAEASNTPQPQPPLPAQPTPQPQPPPSRPSFAEFLTRSPLQLISVGLLRGEWDIVCPAGHVDRVGGLTISHKCERCGKQCVDGGVARVKCPHCHTVDPVEGVTEQHKCSNCGKQTRGVAVGVSAAS